MARYKYKPYRRHSRRKTNNFWWSLLALVVIICGAVILHKSRGPIEVTAEQEESSVVEVDTESPRFELELKEEVEPEPVVTVEVEPVVTEELAPVEEVIAIAEEAANEVESIVETVAEEVEPAELIALRDKLNESVVSGELTAVEILTVKRQLTELSEKWLFSRDTFPGDTLTGLYKVQNGDLLSNIGKKFSVPYQILMTINNIKRPETLRAGETIKVIKGPFHSRIDLSSFTMDLYLGNKTYVKTYDIGIGGQGKETPTGRWLVKKGGKLVKPTWVDPDTNKTYVPDDPDYPLGSRYIALEGLEGNAKGRTGFAVHGTKDPESISTRSSRGCIRLYNGDVLEFYSLVFEGLSEVRIAD